MSDKSKSQLEVLVDRLHAAIESISWDDPEKHPVLRKGQTEKRIETFEGSIGKLPTEYREFLKLANGMEGAYGRDWLIRGTTDSRIGKKFKTYERDYIPADKENPNDSLYRDAFSPTADDAFLVAGDFESDVAFLRVMTTGGFGPEVELYRSPDLIAPVVTFDSFVEFLEFVVIAYESKVASPPSDEVTPPRKSTKSTKATSSKGSAKKSSAKRKATYDDDDDYGDYDLDAESGYGSFDEYGDYDDDDESYDGFSEELDLSDEYDDDDDDSFVPLQDDEAIRGLVAKMTKQSRVREEERTAKLAPEMEAASKIVEDVIKRLIDEDLLELVEKPNARADLEDKMLTKLVSSRDRRDAVKTWFKVLLSAPQVDDLYGTDSEVEEVLNSAFDD